MAGDVGNWPEVAYCQATLENFERGVSFGGWKMELEITHNNSPFSLHGLKAIIASFLMVQLTS